jgi:hypothetical protein
MATKNGTRRHQKKEKSTVSKKEDNKKIDMDDEKLKKVFLPSVVIIVEGLTEDTTSGISAEEKSMEQLHYYLRDIPWMG